MFPVRIARSGNNSMFSPLIHRAWDFPVASFFFFLLFSFKKKIFALSSQWKANCNFPTSHYFLIQIISGRISCTHFKEEQKGHNTGRKPQRIWRIKHGAHWRIQVPNKERLSVVFMSSQHSWSDLLHGRAAWQGAGSSVSSWLTTAFALWSSWKADFQGWTTDANEVLVCTWNESPWKLLLE